MSPPLKLLLILTVFCSVPFELFAWTNGELLIWMDTDRGHALAPIAKKFENDFGLKVTIETPEKITDSFPIAAQCGKGPDIVIWAHDKVGEWADAGLIAPVEVSNEFLGKFLPKAWEAVIHKGWVWGYPVALETVALIYNKKLLEGSSAYDAFRHGVRKRGDQKETSRGDRHPVGLQEPLLLLGDSG